MEGGGGDKGAGARRCAKEEGRGQEAKCAPSMACRPWCGTTLRAKRGWAGSQGGAHLQGSFLCLDLLCPALALLVQALELQQARAAVAHLRDGWRRGAAGRRLSGDRQAGRPPVSCARHRGSGTGSGSPFPFAPRPAPSRPVSQPVRRQAGPAGRAGSPPAWLLPALPAARRQRSGCAARLRRTPLRTPAAALRAGAWPAACSATTPSASCCCCSASTRCWC